MPNSETTDVGSLPGVFLGPRPMSGIRPSRSSQMPTHVVCVTHMYKGYHVCLCLSYAPQHPESPTADAMADNFRRHKPNASRIPNDRWEELKLVLLENCQAMTFDELARYMKREHNFGAK